MEFLSELPVEYKKTILIGYFSVVLLIFAAFMNFLFTMKYGTINGNWGGPLTVVPMVMATIFFYYVLIKTFRDKKIKDNFVLINTAFIISLLINLLINIGIP